MQALRINGQTLTDVFTYTVTDAGGLTDTNQVTITIRGRNDKPVANADQGTAIESGGVFNGTAGADAVGNVLSNDTDVDAVANGETKNVTGVLAGTASNASGAVASSVTGVYGAITINSDGSYTYIIDESNAAVQALRINGQTLTDVFTYTVTDAGGLTDTNQVTITIRGRNDNPVANADQGTALEWGGVFNTLVGSDAVGNVLDNDTDVDSETNGETKAVTGLVAGLASYTSGSVGSVVVGEYGSITILADGSFSYVTDENDHAVQALRLFGQTLTDVFTYTVTDAGGLTDTNQLTVTIRGRNDNPVANADQGTAIEKGGSFNGTAGAHAVGNV
ncbi:MAG: VCBS domain-containing protein, partial [Pirellula sp.]